MPEGGVTEDGPEDDLDGEDDTECQTPADLFRARTESLDD